MSCCPHCDNASEDHDMLIQINTKLERVLQDKADRETRLRRVERWGFIGLGIVYAYEFFQRLWGGRP